jgi:LmbE family N-acetylglucosaminyl deacetylase
MPLVSARDERISFAPLRPTSMDNYRLMSLDLPANRDPTPQSPAPTVLLLTAHCDDAELWAGGTILRYVAAGWRVIAAIAHHDGHRREETGEGGRILGFEPRFRQEGTSLVAWVRKSLASAGAEVLLTHAPHDLHPQHRAVFAATFRAIRGETFDRWRPSRWYHFDTYLLTRVPATPPVLIDISSEFPRKCQALRCHRSQAPGQLVRMSRYMNGLHGMQLQTRYAEAFYPLPLMGRWPAMRDLP